MYLVCARGRYVRMFITCSASLKLAGNVFLVVRQTSRADQIRADVACQLPFDTIRPRSHFSLPVKVTRGQSRETKK
jgi:hypothetical protein